jgi:hypothetical protein
MGTLLPTPAEEGAPMSTWMVVLAAVIVLLPFILMVAFNGKDRTDARGRRLNAGWRVQRQKI